MYIYKWILVLALLSLLALSAQRAVAEPIEIEVELPHIKVFAFSKVLDKWGSEQWDSFDKIIDKESFGWTVTDAHYKSGYAPSGVKSSAHGLAGFLDATWGGVGCKKTDDPYIQIDCATKYIEARYGTPDKAWDHHKRKNWY